MPKIHLLNPTLPKNIPTVVALMKSEHGANPGLLHAYEVYTLDDGMGGQTSFALTLPVMQFIEDPVSDSTIPEFRLDIVEPAPEGGGQFGHILPVVKSIISNHGVPIFDQQGSYIVKEIVANQNGLSDKPNKPNWFVRAANREHYLGSQLPLLGIRYGLIKEEHVSFLHMNRAPGLSLNRYVKKLNAEQFLSLACTLLEEVPQQIHQTVRLGKHEGEKIVHCDLKSQNIMAEWKENRWIVTVVDAGLAKTMKGDKYISKRPQGNTMVADSKMLFATQTFTPITYDTQTDLYALYVTIAELAGAPSRDELNDKAMLADLKKPNLAGIFDHMGFDPITKEKLIHLVEWMLCDNRAQRAPREEALKEFKEALIQVQNNNQTCPVSETVKPAKRKITAEELKNWIEQNLEHLIIQKEQSGQSKSTTLKLWIKHFRELRFLAGPEEMERFNTMGKEGLQIKSRYVYDLMRFDLIKEYDTNACVRLLLRNEELTAPLREVYPLTDAWHKFFSLYLNQLPIQLTTQDDAFCEEIGTFKRNVSDVLSTSIKEDQTSLLWQMKEELKHLASLQFTQWAEQLPLFARRFNQQYECMGHVSRLFQQFSRVFTLKENFFQEFNNWGDGICKKAINGRFPENADEYFEQYQTLATLLFKFSSLKERFLPLFNVFPVLNESTFNLQALEQSIQSFDLSNPEEVVSLSKKLTLLLTLLKMYSYLYDPKITYPHKQYPKVMRVNEEQLKELIRQSPPEEEFIDELEDLLNYCSAINQLDDFIHKYGHYKNIAKAFFLLMSEDKSTVLQLDAMISNVPEHCLGKLDLGLAPLMSLKGDERLNERLFAEICRFFSFPIRYTPINLSFNLFQPSKPASKIKDEALELKSNLSL